MKKALAILVALGIILGGGVNVAVSADIDYWNDVPQAVTPEGGN